MAGRWQKNVNSMLVALAGFMPASMQAAGQRESSAAVVTHTAAAEKSQMMENAITLLASHKDDTGKIFAYFKDNKTNLLSILKLLSENPEGMADVLEMGASPEGKATLMAKLTDARAKDSLAFMIENRAELKYLQQLSLDPSGWLGTDLNFIAAHASELAEMTKFAAAHPEQTTKAAHFATNAGSSASMWDYITNLGSFALAHPLQLHRLKAFSEKHESEIGMPSSQEMEALQKLGTFAMANQEKILALAEGGMAGIQKGLGDFIAVQQKQTDAKREEAERIARETKEAGELAAFKEQLHNLMQQGYADLQKANPALYTEAVDLSLREAGFTHAPKSPARTEAVRTWIDQVLAFNGKLKAAYPAAEKEILALHYASPGIQNEYLHDHNMDDGDKDAVMIAAIEKLKANQSALPAGDMPKPLATPKSAESPSAPQRK